MSVPEMGLRVAAGFQAHWVAEPRLTPNPAALAVDAWGRVLVGGTGYIRVLQDADTNGVAERVTVFAMTPGAVTALAVEGAGVLAIVDQALLRYRDNNQDGVADGPPEKLLTFTGPPNAWRALRQGADRWWYVLCGAGDAPQRGFVPLDSSPVSVAEGGALYRFSPDWHEYEVVAHGFHHPGGLDFNEAGDAFTADGEAGADFGLPWYAPASVHQVAFGGHHGWRNAVGLGAAAGRARPDYYADTVRALTDLGRARPSAVVVYQHHQFPERYQQGLMVADWAWGRVFFVPLHPDGTSYTGAPELFLEAEGRSGFAPTALAVAPDGALLVASGRGGQSGVCRITHTGPDRVVRDVLHLVRSAGTLESTLAVPQPWEAWSRAAWVPVAQRLGPEVYVRAVVDPLRPPEQRARAIEVLVHTFDGLPAREAAVAARAPEPEVRARAAWALGVKPAPGFTGVLLELGLDAHPWPRRVALEALLERYLELENLSLQGVLRENLGHPDSRIRQLAARLAARLPQAAWERLRQGLRADAPSRLGAAQVFLLREPGVSWHTNALELALGAWNATSDTGLRTEALSVMMLALGDYRRVQPGWDTFAGFGLQTSFQGHEMDLRRLRLTARSAFSAGQTVLDVELARFLAMLADDEARTLRKVLERIQANTPPSLDFHYLCVAARLPLAREASMTSATADALAGLGRKLVGVPPESLAGWQPRLVELGRHLLARDPALAEALVRHPDFARPPLLPLVPLLSPALQRQAAARFLAAAQRDAQFPCTPELLQVLALLPPEQTRGFLRRRWPTVDLPRQWEIAVELARAPEAGDRVIFLGALETGPLEVVEASLRALAALPPEDNPRHLVPVARALRRLAAMPEQGELRQQTLRLLERQTGQKFSITETNLSAGGLAAAYQPVWDWLAQHHPNAVREPQLPAAPALKSLEALLRSTPWAKGDAQRGAARFERSCAVCHADPLRAPPLEQGAARLPPLELFPHIAYPQLRVAEEYRLREYQLTSGQSVTGRPLFEGMEIRLVQTTQGVVRLRAAEIVRSVPAAGSLMPEGLLKGWAPADLADLWMFLRDYQGWR
jgi:putative membrane-bound dehydrogenase-like protein